MNKETLLSPWIKRFLLEYLITERNLSRNTVLSYRDTFRQCIPFISKKAKKPIHQLTVKDMSPKGIKLYLLDLEARHRSTSTRNQRLSAIHAFADFIGLNNPEHIEWCRQIHLIPLKKAKQSEITYLEKNEMQALLAAPDQSTKQGRRDYALLLFLYNSGARASEIAKLKIEDLYLASDKKKNFSVVQITGKGNKLRRCPLWKQTVNELASLTAFREQNEHVFLNRMGQPITRFGIHNMVRRYVKKILPDTLSLKNKRISPHTIRHTTATHLLNAGVDINTIRAWLGHVSINTTNIYVEVNMEIKAKALAKCEQVGKQAKKRVNVKNEFIQFLDAI